MNPAPLCLTITFYLFPLFNLFTVLGRLETACIILISLTLLPDGPDLNALSRRTRYHVTT